VPFEGTYGQDGDPLSFDLHNPDGWRWRLAVPAVAGVTAEDVTAAGIEPRVRLVRQSGQRVARLVHRGPYADELPSLDALYAYVADAGLTAAGPHTEVYVTDPSTTPPADLRTWLQVPVR
jgi:effector-binding domain-containing protein